MKPIRWTSRTWSTAPTASIPTGRRFRAGLQAAEAKVSEAKSGYFPKLALMGSLNIISNAYDKGMMTPTNKTNWMAGIGLEIPDFQWFPDGP